MSGEDVKKGSPVGFLELIEEGAKEPAPPIERIGDLKNAPTKEGELKLGDKSGEDDQQYLQSKQKKKKGFSLIKKSKTEENGKNEKNNKRS